MSDNPKHPFIKRMLTMRDTQHERAKAHGDLAKAYDGMARITNADDMKQSYRERAESARAMASMADEAAVRYDTAAFCIDEYQGDERLVAIADAAQMIWGYDCPEDLAERLRMSGDLSEDDADKAASLFWDGEA